jgi:hypothetical protein
MTATTLDHPGTTNTTLVGQEADLLRRLQEILTGHPAGSAFKLLLAPTGLAVADDEVLVQEHTDRGVLELRPRKIHEVSLSDVLHTTQVIDPSDQALGQYANTPVTSHCWKHNGSHFYS